MSTEPGELAFGELAGADFDEFDGFSEIVLAAQMFSDLSISDGLQGGSIFGETELEQEFHFRNQATFEHGIDAGVDAGMQIGGLTSKSKEMFGDSGAWRTKV